MNPEPARQTTIFFSDIVGFTDISSSLEASKVSDMLERFWLQMDGLCTRFGLFKARLIADWPRP